MVCSCDTEHFSGLCVLTVQRFLERPECCHAELTQPSICAPAQPLKAPALTLKSELWVRRTLHLGFACLRGGGPPARLVAMLAPEGAWEDLVWSFGQGLQNV